MGKCAGCKVRTSSFCFVHKHNICESCISELPSGRSSKYSTCLCVVCACVIHNFEHLCVYTYDLETKCEPNCIIRNYFDWILSAGMLTLSIFVFHTSFHLSLFLFFFSLMLL